MLAITDYAGSEAMLVAERISLVPRSCRRERKLANDNPSKKSSPESAYLRPVAPSSPFGATQLFPDNSQRLLGRVNFEVRAQRKFGWVQVACIILAMTLFMVGTTTFIFHLPINPLLDSRSVDLPAEDPRLHYLGP